MSVEHRHYRLGETVHLVHTVRQEPGRLLVRLGEKEFAVEARSLEEGRLLLRLDGRQVVVDWARRERELFIQVEGECYHLHEEDAARPHGEGDHGGEEDEPILSAPMPGKVVKLLIRPGDIVSKGDAVVIIDSMKVEFEVKSPRPGTVDQVLVQEGKQLELGENLIIFR